MPALTSRNIQQGRAGEDAAIRALTEAGYQIIERNWRCVGGEIDIVAQQGGEWVFIEVRLRHNSLEAALESISRPKQRRLLGLVQEYLNQHQLGEVSHRIDVVAIHMVRKLLSQGKSESTYEIEIIPHAVGW